MKDRMVAWVQDLQNRIVSALESFEPSIKFQKNIWQRPGGGGGDTRIIQGGKIFEKGGVNTSVVFGKLPQAMVEKLQAQESDFFATGISLVLHPVSPLIPTIHMNYRYFEQPDRHWFGGGTDLTPYVWDEPGFKDFHSVLKQACDAHSHDYYSRFKEECDRYFYLPHREETRGVGGIFFDYLKEDREKTFQFVQACGESFLSAYSPFVERGCTKVWTERQKKFQLLRRGRYVEFNLIYDRGTLFGLQTKGNIESILMSLPPIVHFDYQAEMEFTEDERKLMTVFRQPRAW